MYKKDKNDDVILVKDNNNINNSKFIDHMLKDLLYILWASYYELL